uniref:Choline transporter-like protein n=1 Tax=Trichogramma kaykai TaxID=54128 RepID=A0ABD2XCX0_9HYME
MQLVCDCGSSIFCIGCFNIDAKEVVNWQNPDSNVILSHAAKSLHEQMYHLGSVLNQLLRVQICKIAQTFSGSAYIFHNESCSMCNFDQDDNVMKTSDLAYIYIGLHGTDFENSETITFKLWSRNYDKVAVATNVCNTYSFFWCRQYLNLNNNHYTFTFPFSFFHKIAHRLILFCSISTVAILALVYSGLTSAFSMDSTQSMTALLFIWFLVFIAINSIFLLLDVAIDTILICALEDYEVNSNSARVYYMSDRMKKLLLENKII